MNKEVKIAAMTFACAVAMAFAITTSGLWAARAQDQNMNPNTNSNANANTSSSTNANTTQSMMMKLSSADQKFMMMAAMGGMAEIEQAQLALQKSTNNSVKEYAQKMIDDHTKTGDELKALAATKGIMLPAQPDAKHLAKMAKLQKLSGAEFDMMYLKEAGVKAHQEMEKLFMKESVSGADADAKAFAAKTLPAVQMHLQMAREMMTSMKGAKDSSSASGMKM